MKLLIIALASAALFVLVIALFGEKQSKNVPDNTKLIECVACYPDSTGSQLITKSFYVFAPSTDSAKVLFEQRIIKSIPTRNGVEVYFVEKPVYK